MAFFQILIALLLTAHLSSPASIADRLPEAQPLIATPCTWHGTAPFCDGSCPEHLLATRRSSSRILDYGSFFYKDSSFGLRCLTGTKVHCCKKSP